MTTAGHIETSMVAVSSSWITCLSLERVQGAASVVRGGFDLGSDQWPIDAFLQLERKDLWGTIGHDEFSQLGWAPRNEAAKRLFMRGVANDLSWLQGEARGKALTIVEELIYSHAVGIGSDNAALRQWIELQNHRARLAELRSTLRQEDVREVRKDLRRDMRRELTAKLRMVKGQQLDRLLAGYLERGKETLMMQLPDGPSGDTHAWAAAAGAHGREVCRDDDNDTDARLQRLERHQQMAQREMARGWQPPAVKLHDSLNAIASAKACKQPGVDGVVVEMVRSLSWPTLFWLYLLFLGAIGELGDRDLRLGEKLCWWPFPRNLAKVGFRAMRYTSLLPVLQKFYVRALQAVVRRERRPHESNILGVEPGRRTA